MAETEAAVLDDRDCWLVYVNDFGRATPRKLFSSPGGRPQLDEAIRKRTIGDPIKLEGLLRDFCLRELMLRFPPPRMAP